MKGLLGFLAIILLIALTANAIFHNDRNEDDPNEIQDTVMTCENDTIIKKL